MQTVGDLRKALEGLPDDMEVLVQNTNTGWVHPIDDTSHGKYITSTTEEDEDTYSDDEYFTINVSDDIDIGGMA